jgi:hypothetical protein
MCNFHVSENLVLSTGKLELLKLSKQQCYRFAGNRGNNKGLQFPETLADPLLVRQML